MQRTAEETDEQAGAWTDRRSTTKPSKQCRLISSTMSCPLFTASIEHASRHMHNARNGCTLPYACNPHKTPPWCARSILILWYARSLVSEELLWPIESILRRNRGPAEWTSGWYGIVPREFLSTRIYYLLLPIVILSWFRWVKIICTYIFIRNFDNGNSVVIANDTPPTLRQNKAHETKRYY